MSTAERARPRLGPGLVVLLVVITVANLLALVIAVEAWYDEMDHGGDLVAPAALSAGLAVVALVGIGGAWSRQTWGPPLYLATQVLALVFALAAAPEALGPLFFVPLLLAGLLWLLAG